MNVSFIIFVILHREKKRPMDIRHIHLEEVDSTNNYLKHYKQAPGENITFVWTNAQMAGRGCGNNSWECEAGKNVTFSILFHPLQVPAPKQFIISMANALAIKEALEHFVDDITVKWPNDIYWKDGKLAGTLIEPSLRGGRVEDCIIGTGINVNQIVFRSNAPNPVSLKQACQCNVEREEVAAMVTKSLLRHISMLETPGNWSDIRKAYRGSLYRKEGLHWYQAIAEEPFKAAIRHVEDDGTLVLECYVDGEKPRLRKFEFKELKYII